MKVKSEQNPNTSFIQESLEKIDFTDTFSTTNHKNSVEEVAQLIFGSMPSWIAFLFRLRNRLVRFLRLKVETPDQLEGEMELGAPASFFEVFATSGNEIILGKDDTHLKFRVSIFNSSEKAFNIKVTTLVEYCNRTGKIYMNIIRPFHWLVVRAMVKRAYLK